jgi:hypothetical protein
MTEPLEELELRVGGKWVAAAAARTPEWSVPDFEFDMSAWTDVAPLPPGTMQFPREQWVSYPRRRTMSLLVVDRMLDLDMNDEQWGQVCFLMQYGGKERIA